MGRKAHKVKKLLPLFRLGSVVDNDIIFSMPKKRVSFTATRRISKPVTIKFKTSLGKTVSFKAVKKVSKPVRVTFTAKKK